MKEDYIVNEVREVRRKIEEECGNDNKRLLEKALEIQKKYANRLVSRGPVPARKLTGTNS